MSKGCCCCCCQCSEKKEDKKEAGINFPAFILTLLLIGLPVLIAVRDTTPQIIYVPNR